MFLDRDGVLNARPPEHEYVMSADQFDWLPGAREAVVQLKRAGWKVAVVSNQRGRRARTRLAGDAGGDRGADQADLRPEAALDGFFYCPHDLDESCDCRKPQPGADRARGRRARSRAEGQLDDRRRRVRRRRGPRRRLLDDPDRPDARQLDAADLVEPDLLPATRWLC